MPLIQSASKEALSENISKEVEAGKDPKQAVAIAYSTQRSNKDEDPSYFAVDASDTLAAINKRNNTFWRGQQ